MQARAQKRSLPYAHLLGGLMGRVKGAKADDTEPPDEPLDEDSQNTVDIDDEDINPDEPDEDTIGQAKGKGKGAKAEDDEKKIGPDDAGAEEGEDDEGKDTDEPAGKRAKRAQDDDTDENAKAMRAGRRIERARCAAIFNCTAAGTRPDLAAHLAFNTGMSSANAIAMLETTVAGAKPLTQGSSSRSGLGERMAEQRIPNPGAGMGGGAPSLAQQIVAANNRRLGIKPQK